MTVDIKVDEQACVGCALCVEICPTKVFEFNDATGVPDVKKQTECFGCLSCAEICPATALDHGDIGMSQSFYHDPTAFEMVSKLGTPPRHLNVPTTNQEALEKAKEDLGIRLLSVAAVLKQTIGQSLAAIGTQAGRSLAQQLPRYQQPSSINEALALAVSVFAPAWALGFDLNDKACTMRVGTCFIRELCTRHKMDLGGDLCTLFYGYCAGYLSRIAGVRPRLINAQRGNDACTYTMQLYPAAGS